MIIIIISSVGSNGSSSSRCGLMYGSVRRGLVLGSVRCGSALGSVKVSSAIKPVIDNN